MTLESITPAVEFESINSILYSWWFQHLLIKLETCHNEAEAPKKKTKNYNIFETTFHMKKKNRT